MKAVDEEMKAANICLTKLRQLRNWKVYTNLLNFSVYDEILPSGVPRTLQNINDTIFQWIIYFAKSRYLHCVKSVQIRSFFWSVFSCIQSEYRKIRTRKNSVFGRFLRSGILRTVSIIDFWQGLRYALYLLALYLSIIYLLERRLIQRNSLYFRNSYLHDLSRLHAGFNKHQ